MHSSLISRIAWPVAIASLVLTAPARAGVLEQSKKVHGVTVRYKVVLPDGYDPTKTYPGILAFGGVPQTMNTVTAC